MERKKALVTGVTGQAGHYIVDKLLKHDYDVYGFKRRSSTENTGRISSFLNKIELIEGDVTDSVSVNETVSKLKPDKIFNAAAQSHVATSFKQPLYTFQATGLSVFNFLEAIKNYSPNSRFIQFSSSEMFGKSFDVRQTISPNVMTKYQCEDTIMTPQSPYAIAKLAGHHAVRLYRESYGIFACSMICFNYEGPHRGENFVTRKITRWLGEFNKWKADLELDCEYSFSFDIPEDMISVVRDVPNSWAFGPKFPKLRLGNLNAYRDWSHASDTINAIYLASERSVADDYVISTGETHSVLEFVKLAFKYAGIEDDPMNYIVIDPEFYRPAEVDYLLGDSKKAQFFLNWKPQVSFSDLVKEMVEYDS